MDTGKLPTPEKIARQRASAQMPKCKCGNVARFGQELCGRCESEKSAADYASFVLSRVPEDLESRVDRIAIDVLGREHGIESRQVKAVVRLIAEIVQLNGLKIPR